MHWVGHEAVERGQSGTKFKYSHLALKSTIMQIGTVLELPTKTKLKNQQLFVI